MRREREREEMFNTNKATDLELYLFAEGQKGKCLCIYCDGCGKDRDISWALCNECLETEGHGIVADTGTICYTVLYKPGEPWPKFLPSAEL